MMTMPLLGFILIPIVSGLMMYIRPHNWVKKVTVLIQVLLLFCSIDCLQKLHTVPEVIEHLSVYPLPVGMTLRLDRLSQVTLLLNNGLFLLMTIFAYREKYMNKLFIYKKNTTFVLKCSNFIVILLFSNKNCIHVSVINFQKK